MTNYIDFLESNGNECTRASRFREAKETIAAQAAVIGELREALTACVCAMQDHQAGIGITEIFDKSEALGRKILAIPTDSTQILAEVRRAEREKCAKVCEELRHPDEYSVDNVDWFADWCAGTDHCAEAIRAME